MGDAEYSNANGICSWDVVAMVSTSVSTFGTNIEFRIFS
jgi:hypothetical protein